MSSNTFALATNIQTYCYKHDKQNSGTSTPINIFNEHELRLVDPNSISSSNSKSYEIVGLKEIKNLQKKTRKQKKNTCKKAVQSRDDRPETRQSRLKKTSKLNKRQILQTLPAISPSKQKNIPTKIHTGAWMTGIDDFEYSVHQEMTAVKNSSRANQFSIRRLKESVGEKEREWNKLLGRISRSDSKFPSVFRRIQNYRKILQDKEKNTIVHQLSNSYKWPHILRSETRINQMSLRKEIPRTFHDKGLFSLSGRSKLKNQEKWLDKKEQEGYQFRLLGQSQTSSPTQSKE